MYNEGGAQGRCDDITTDGDAEHVKKSDPSNIDGLRRACARSARRLAPLPP